MNACFYSYWEEKFKVEGGKACARGMLMRVWLHSYRSIATKRGMLRLPQNLIATDPALTCPCTRHQLAMHNENPAHVTEHQVCSDIVAPGLVRPAGIGALDAFPVRM